MFNSSTRFQYIFNFSTTLIGAISLLIVVFSFFEAKYTKIEDIVDAEISVIRHNLFPRYSANFGAHDGKTKENSIIYFSLNTDLRKLFGWNTKQVYVYLTAHYHNKKFDTENSVVYWDKIITEKEKAVLNFKQIRSKYSVWDPLSDLSKKNGTLTLHWNIQPHVGFLVFGKTKKSVNFTFEKITL